MRELTAAFTDEQHVRIRDHSGQRVNGSPELGCDVSSVRAEVTDQELLSWVDSFLPRRGERVRNGRRNRRGNGQHRHAQPGGRSHRVGHGRGRLDVRRLADALGAVGPDQARMLDEDRVHARHVERGRHLVVREIRVQHAAALVDDLLGERLAQPLRHPALDLPLDVRGVHGEADVLRDHVLVERDLARLGIDGEVDRVGVETRRVEGRIDVPLHALGVVRRRRRDERALRDEAAARLLRQPREVRERDAFAVRHHVLVGERARLRLDPELGGGEREDARLEVGDGGPAGIAHGERRAAALRPEVERRGKGVGRHHADVREVAL